MKNIRSTSYLCLLAGLFSASQALAQHDHTDSYQGIGWWRAILTLQVSVKTTDSLQLRTPLLSPLAMLGDDTLATAAVQKFAAIYPGRESIVFTNELLAVFDRTKEQTEGFHLFFGLENGQFTPMIVHTNIDRDAVVGTNHNGADRRHYRADFNKAYFWDNAARRWQVVVDSMVDPNGIHTVVSRMVKARILANRNLFPFDTKGYYLSKDRLVDAWKSAGRQPLTMFFQLEGNQVHLVCPSYNPIDVTKALSKAIATKGEGRRFPLRITRLHTGGPSIRRVVAFHSPIRSCPTYCGDESVLITTK